MVRTDVSSQEGTKLKKKLLAFNTAKFGFLLIILAFKTSNHILAFKMPKLAFNFYEMDPRVTYAEGSTQTFPWGMPKAPWVCKL